jgi:hypothetical protein
MHRGRPLVGPQSECRSDGDGLFPHLRVVNPGEPMPCYGTRAFCVDVQLRAASMNVFHGSASRMRKYVDAWKKMFMVYQIPMCIASTIMTMRCRGFFHHIRKLQASATSPNDRNNVPNR